MNCDTFLAELETGNFLKRLQARRHARTCPACSAALAAWSSAREQLSEAPPLSPELRDLWLQAAQTAVVRPPAGRLLRPSRVAVLVACLVLLALVLRLQKGEEDVAKKNLAQIEATPDLQSTTQVVVIDPARELSELAEAVDQLEAELKDLERFAQRREAERQFAVLLKRVEVW